jgi:hypothetical protein
MQVVEVRGGSVQVEAGGDGATFVGVTFLSLKHTPQDTQVRPTHAHIHTYIHTQHPDTYPRSSSLAIARRPPPKASHPHTRE